VKGAGEAGIIVPASVISNAVESALAHDGVKLGSMTSTPLTPSMVRYLVQQATKG